MTLAAFRRLALSLPGAVESAHLGRPDFVALYFAWGTKLPDPEGILLGAGNQGRFVRVVRPATLNRPEVKALLKAAIRQARAPLPKTGRGMTVIRSIFEETTAPPLRRGRHELPGG